MASKIKLLKALRSVRGGSARAMTTTSRLQHQAAIQVHTDWSYMAGPSGADVPPLTDLTIGQTVERGAELFGDREGLVDVADGQRRSFIQLREEINSLAAGFLELGLEQGARIGIWGPSTVEWYLTQFAAARAGLVLVNINPAYQAEELRYCINKVGISAIVCHDKFKTQDYYKLH